MLTPELGVFNSCCLSHSIRNTWSATTRYQSRWRRSTGTHL